MVEVTDQADITLARLRIIIPDLPITTDRTGANGNMRFPTPATQTRTGQITGPAVITSTRTTILPGMDTIGQGTVLIATATMSTGMAATPAAATVVVVMMIITSIWVWQYF